MSMEAGQQASSQAGNNRRLCTLHEHDMALLFEGRWIFLRTKDTPERPAKVGSHADVAAACDQAVLDGIGEDVRWPVLLFGDDRQPKLPERLDIA